MSNELYQIVYCSRRSQRRAFRIEYRVSRRNAIVTDVQVLQPGYDKIMRLGRSENEPVVDIDVKVIGAHPPCPICNNTRLYICEVCYSLSCIGRDDVTHDCPICHDVAHVAPAHALPFSASGFTDRAQRQVGSRAPAIRVIDAEPVEPLWEERPRIEAPVRDLLPVLQRQDTIRRLLGSAPDNGPRALPPGAQRLLGDGGRNSRNPRPPAGGNGGVSLKDLLKSDAYGDDDD